MTLLSDLANATDRAVIADTNTIAHSEDIEINQNSIELAEVYCKA
jgi:hypothetical protein